MEEDPEHRALALRVAASANDIERKALLKWMLLLIQVRESDLSSLGRAHRAVKLTLDSKVLWPILKLLSLEIKRLGWDDRSTKGRYSIIGSGLGLALFGTQGAGIAALGTAIGVPIWVVLGTGAYFVPILIDEIRKKIPEHHNVDLSSQEPIYKKRAVSINEEIDILDRVVSAVDQKAIEGKLKFATENEQEVLLNIPLGADVNDLIECTHCRHQIMVTYKWLDKLSQRIGGARLLRLDKKIISRLKCGNCGSRDFTVRQAKLPDVDIVVHENKPIFCSICSGDGGAGGRCWKCGGNGFANN